MAKMSTQDRERHYFELFRKHYGLSDKSVEYGDKPDVIILEGGRKIGIEITNFFLKSGDRPESEQVQRVVRTKVIKNAHYLYMRDNGKKFELTFTFSDCHPILDQDKLVSEIVTLAKRAEPCKTGRLEIDFLQGIPELSSVYLNAKEYDDPKWRIAQVHEVPFMSPSGLNKIIKDKEMKHPQYRECDAYWLLVVVDFIDAAQDQEIIQSDKFNAINSTVFENIVIYKPQFAEIVEIRRRTGSVLEA